jgi:hypothetical protein
MVATYPIHLQILVRGVQLSLCSLHTKCGTTSCNRLHTKYIRHPPVKAEHERGRSGSDYRSVPKHDSRSSTQHPKHSVPGFQDPSEELIRLEYRHKIPVIRRGMIR